MVPDTIHFALDEGVPRFAVCRDGRDPHGAMCVGQVVWFLKNGRAGAPRMADALVHVRNL